MPITSLRSLPAPAAGVKPEGLNFFDSGAAVQALRDAQEGVTCYCVECWQAMGETPEETYMGREVCCFCYADLCREHAPATEAPQPWTALEVGRLEKMSGIFDDMGF